MLAVAAPLFRTPSRRKGHEAGHECLLSDRKTTCRMQGVLAQRTEPAKAHPSSCSADPGVLAPFRRLPPTAHVGRKSPAPCSHALWPSSLWPRWSSLPSHA
ncbi:hypothetical protein GOP47_0020217 [Adiantum capillus-veneris]|uniref:Uncharacterized protein n=1 Tax=Adiantum capillus-veneris TaxID=13818 RepID=A0A9D4UD21_ADICA|nr:hypothetical protein GOP47_0020217 [Adiantum capillus-veneris]